MIRAGQPKQGEALGEAWTASLPPFGWPPPLPDLQQQRAQRCLQCAAALQATGEHSAGILVSPSVA